VLNAEYQNIHKSFGRRHILRGVTLELTSGRCCLLTGVNGTGKSTLLRICAGLEKPDAGNIDIGFGRQNWSHRLRMHLQKQIVYMHQHPYMFDGSVLHNLAYALHGQHDKSQHRQRLDMALDWAGLTAIADSHAKTLSGGERQRVALARAWLRSPRFMLLDEPTSNLDVTARRRTLALLISLKAQGIALLIASHENEHFSGLVDSCLALENGTVVNQADIISTEDNVIPLIKTQQA